MYEIEGLRQCDPRSDGIFDNAVQRANAGIRTCIEIYENRSEKIPGLGSVVWRLARQGKL